MQKKLIMVIGVVLIALGSFMGFFPLARGFCSDQGEKKEIVSKKEMALTIGSTILKNHFNISTGVKFEVKDEGDKWKVFSVFLPKTAEDGTKVWMVGGQCYVIFKKSDCQIQNIGVDD
ncbi:MAG TPA: hypothetical protein VF941_09750 [Clostridia bacterium]